jgi:hypothetical protein
MGIVIANNPLIVSVMQGQRILNAMRNMLIDRTSESTEFSKALQAYWQSPAQSPASSPPLITQPFHTCPPAAQYHLLPDTTRTGPRG